MNAHDRGFTLVEALIALALTALVTTSLYSGLFGVGRTARAAAEQNRTDDTRRLTARVLHDLLAGAVPFAEARRDEVTVLFEGRRDGVRFVGHMPAHANSGGLQLVDVHVAGAAATSRLELSFRNVWPETELGVPLTDGGWSHENLAAGPAQLRARYYAPRGAARSPRLARRVGGRGAPAGAGRARDRGAGRRGLAADRRPVALTAFRHGRRMVSRGAAVTRARATLPAAGYALVLVLWTLALLALAVSSFVHTQRVETTLVGLHQQTVRARALAESGIWLAIARFLDGEGLVEPAFSATVDGTPVDIRIRPVNARIDLNAADEAVLDSALASRGVPDGQRAALVARILDWRDADAEAGARGLEDRGYADLGLPYGAKDAPFYTVDELRFIPGLEETVYRRLSPLLTVFGADGRVNAAFASREVLAALPGTVSGVADEGSSPAGLERAGTFEIESAAALASARVQTVAVVEIARDQDPPFKIAAWTSAGDAL